MCCRHTDIPTIDEIKSSQKSNTEPGLMSVKPLLYAMSRDCWYEIAKWHSSIHMQGLIQNYYIMRGVATVVEVGMLAFPVLRL